MLGQRQTLRMISLIHRILGVFNEVTAEISMMSTGREGEHAWQLSKNEVQRYPNDVQINVTYVTGLHANPIYYSVKNISMWGTQGT